MSGPRIRHDVVWIKVGPDVVAIGPGQSARVIEPPASLLWPFLDGTATTDELAADVAEVFGVKTEQARSDLAGMLRDWVGSGLVEFEANHGDVPPDPGGLEVFPPSYRDRVLLSVADKIVAIECDDDELSEVLERRYEHLRVVDPAAGEPVVETVLGVSTSRRCGAGPRLIPALFEDGRLVRATRSLNRLLNSLDARIGQIHGVSTDSNVLNSATLAGVRLPNGPMTLIPLKWLETFSRRERLLDEAGVLIVEPPAIAVEADTLVAHISRGSRATGHHEDSPDESNASQVSDFAGIWSDASDRSEAHRLAALADNVHLALSDDPTATLSAGRKLLDTDYSDVKMVALLNGL